MFGSVERMGALQRANGGTIILNSIEELQSSLQAKLLRLIVSGELFNIDSNIPHPVNVRVISTTKMDLAKRVEEGLFSEELMYRLNIMGIKMPSLRERRDDIKILIFKMKTINHLKIFSQSLKIRRPNKSERKEGFQKTSSFKNLQGMN